MIHSVREKALLDTNVIFPIVSRDLLFWFAHYDLFIPQWSKHIFDEWALVMERKGVTQAEAVRRISVAAKAFPDALVKDYESLIEKLDLKDDKDRHVLAAAIKAKADVIVTNNIKDFPDRKLAGFGLEAKTADDFLTDLIDLNPVEASEAFREMVLNKKNPALDELQVLEKLRKIGLLATADSLHLLL